MEENKIEFNSVKEQVNEDNELSGYLADGMSIPLAEGNRHYKMVLQWIEEGGVVEEAYTQGEWEAKVKAQALAEWKADRQAQVDAIIVTTDVGDWDGDEASQSRMGRAILSMNDTDTTIWALADNTPVKVTKANLTEALKLSGEEQTSIWVRK